jgi:hypothetical protein
MQPAQPPQALRDEHAVLRTLLRAFLKATGDLSGQATDFATVRALLFHVGEQLDASRARCPAGGQGGRCCDPTACPAGYRGSMACDATFNHEHLRDLEHALTAFEVRGEAHCLAFRTQAFLFAEWQLARLERFERCALQAPEPAPGTPRCGVGNGGPAPVLAQAITAADAGRAAAPPVATRMCGLDDLRERRLVVGSAARASGHDCAKRPLRRRPAGALGTG